MMDAIDVIDRAQILKGMHSTDDRQRIRAVMNGGAEGVQAVLARGGPGAPIRTQGPGTGKGADTSLGIDLPTANIMFSGLERLAQKIGRPPVLKTDMIPTKDTDKARKKAEKRARIVNAWDDISRIEMQYPQIGRWLPGYGFTLHIIKERTFGDTTYPVAELRDPYDVYPGTWGVDQQPSEVAVFRSVSQKELMYVYPSALSGIKKRMATQRSGVPIIGETAGWEGNPHSPVTLIEYYNHHGCYIVCPEIEQILSFIPNPLESGPSFVMTKRFSFDKLQSQYHHVFGLMAMMAKLNILGLIGVEDSTFRETNIIGDMVGKTYERGRFAVNKFEPGTKIEKPTSDQLQQVWQAVGVIERQFRVVAGYDVAQDGQSPQNFATGQGIRELGSAAAENVKEYQTAIKHSMELIDRKRLEWEEKMHPTSRKKVYWFEGGTQFEEHYVPNVDIDKDYRTKRIYGAMATFDENSKIVAGLQLVQARIMDKRTMRENMDGFENPSLMEERIDQDMAKEMLMQGLGQRFGERDQAAGMALVEIFDKPGEAGTTLKKMFTAQDPQMSPEEMAMAQGGEGVEGGPPPAVQTILAQMEAEGGGVQSVGQMT